MTLAKLIVCILGIWAIALTSLSWTHQKIDLINKNAHMRRKIDRIRPELWHLDSQISLELGRINIDEEIKKQGLELEPITPLQTERR